MSTEVKKQPTQNLVTIYNIYTNKREKRLDDFDLYYT